MTTRRRATRRRATRCRIHRRRSQSRRRSRRRLIRRRTNRHIRTIRIHRIARWNLIVRSNLIVGLIRDENLVQIETRPCSSIASAILGNVDDRVTDGARKTPSASDHFICRVAAYVLDTVEWCIRRSEFVVVLVTEPIGFEDFVDVCTVVVAVEGEGGLFLVAAGDAIPLGDLCVLDDLGCPCYYVRLRGSSCPLD